MVDVFPCLRTVPNCQQGRSVLTHRHWNNALPKNCNPLEQEPNQMHCMLPFDFSRSAQVPFKLLEL